MARAYFNAYHSFLKAIEPLNDAERGRLFTALLAYSASGEEMALPGNERILFPTMREQIDRDRARYEARCEQNRRNGSLGGAKRKANAPQTPPKEKEKEKEKEKAKENTPSSPVAEAEVFYRENFGEPTRYILGRMEQLAAQGYDGELLLGALREAARAAAKSPWRYAEAVLLRGGRLDERQYGVPGRRDLLADPLPGHELPKFKSPKKNKSPP